MCGWGGWDTVAGKRARLKGRVRPERQRVGSSANSRRRGRRFAEEMEVDSATRDDANAAANVTRTVWRRWAERASYGGGEGGASSESHEMPNLD